MKSVDLKWISDYKHTLLHLFIYEVCQNYSFKPLYLFSVCNTFLPLIHDCRKVKTSSFSYPVSVNSRARDHLGRADRSATRTKMGLRPNLQHLKQRVHQVVKWSAVERSRSTRKKLTSKNMLAGRPGLVDCGGKCAGQVDEYRSIWISYYHE